MIKSRHNEPTRQRQEGWIQECAIRLDGVAGWYRASPFLSCRQLAQRSIPGETSELVAHDPKAVANELIRRGINDGRPLTHIEVQKLLYFWHGWMLGVFEQPLLDGEWEAWQYGPVLREVYFELNHYRGQPITEEIPGARTQLTNDEDYVLNIVYGYRALGASTLIGISHSKGGPWDKVWHDGRKSAVISNEMGLYDHFTHLLRIARNSSKC